MSKHSTERASERKEGMAIRFVKFDEEKSTMNRLWPKHYILYLGLDSVGIANMPSASLRKTLLAQNVVHLISIWELWLTE